MNKVMTETATTAIDVRAVSAHYNSGNRRVDALREVSLHVRRGEIFGLLGPNGAGKTTLLSCIQGLHVPTAGSVCVAGIDVTQHPARVKRMLGVQLQRTALIDELKATELIEAYAALYDVYLSRAQIDALLKRFDLTDQAGKMAKQMSGGQQQRLSLAIAVSTDPDIVLLDEPTEALDPGARRGVWAMIRAFKEQGRTVVLTTHSMDEAESLCGRVAIMDRGRIVACDSPHQLIAGLGIRPVLKATIELPLEQVRPLAGAMAARYTGEHLEIETQQPVATLNALYDLAGRQGRVLRDIAIRQPNLEDVYLKLTGNVLSQP
jgi:ABC-2 type transport system ATP-binding protein